MISYIITLALVALVVSAVSAARLGKAGVDYRAIRLYRSEVYRNQREAVLQADEMNPASTGEFDWVLQPGRESWHCHCPELAEAGPYTKDTIPESHINCDCQVRPRLKDDDKFMQDLQDYVDGTDSAGAREVAEWSEKYGLEEDGVWTTDGGTSPKAPEGGKGTEDTGAWTAGGEAALKAADAPADFTPPREVARSGVDYSQLPLKQAVGTEMRYLRNKTATSPTGNEFMSIMTTDGKAGTLQGTWEGTSGGVNIKLEDKILALLDDKSYTDRIIVIHTHSNGTGFSGDDLRTMCKYKTIHEMRIACTDGAKYFMAIGKGIRVGDAELKRKIAELSVQICSRYNYVIEGKLVKTALIRFVREINKSLQIAYDWNYDDGGQK
jgi:hypothetical protein